MSNDPAVPTINVSLEDHLAESLRPLLGILPEHIAAELKVVLNPTLAAPSMPSHGPEVLEHLMVRTIPYALLTAISKWARTPAAECAMSGHEPPLRVQDYSMITLLAGTRTSPERKFPFFPTPVTDSQVSRSREVGDRRAVTAVVNALLSIGGSGIATWWAAGRLLWREEWKVLLALLVAAVVAASEATLYLIWDSQRNKPHRRRAIHLHGPIESSGDLSPSKDKKWDPDSACGACEVDSRVVPHATTTTAISTHISGTHWDTLHARIAVSASAPAISKQAL
ncbi:hypothetical protein GSI_12968 [Ganoderma sinense ZZ0214-1]|uniref:Uncharacterized protein n=1 Tax=Ganoderma sinense ZZ0214-1 TaxID=1077348 RepID=A0A2G8RUA4_9APHY|nr:hypothetical protein GSI_12968 [Ganoderma sinense ZZ0214-1]